MNANNPLVSCALTSHFPILTPLMCLDAHVCQAPVANSVESRMSIPDDVGKASLSVIDALRSEPLSLALVLMNLALLRGLLLSWARSPTSASARWLSCTRIRRP